MSNSDKPRVSAQDIENLLEIFRQSGWDEMHLETPGLELFLSNDPNAQGPRPVAAGPAPVASALVHTAGAAPATPSATPSAAATAPSGHAPLPPGHVAIKAPNLGSFYRSPKPGAAPYVEVGQQITPETEVCLIEVMKLFTPVQGGVKGIVREIRARDGQMVEFDEVLIVVEPN